MKKQLTKTQILEAIEYNLHTTECIDEACLLVDALFNIDFSYNIWKETNKGL